MYKVKDFIRWALTHVKGAEEPWQYLFGSVRVKTTQATLDYYWENHYKKQKGMTRAKYDALTRDWDRNGYATDCEGLLDAWLTYEKNDPTDINAKSLQYGTGDQSTIGTYTVSKTSGAPEDAGCMFVHCNNIADFEVEIEMIVNGVRYI